MSEKNPIRKYIILFLLILFAFTKAGLEGYSFMGNHISAKTIPIGVGTSLENSKVVSFMQDNEGFIWFLTPRGIIRFDGSEQRVFYIDEVRSEFSSIDLGKDNNFWIGTNNGEVFKFDLERYEFEKLKNKDLPPDKILSIFYDSNDMVWIGTKKNLYKYDTLQGEMMGESVFENLSAEGSIPEITAIAEGENTEFLIGTSRGLIYYDVSKNIIENYIGMIGAPNSRINSIELGKNNTFWIASDNGFFKLDLKTGMFKSLANIFDRENTIRARNITALARDKKGDIFLGTMGEGLYRYNVNSQQFEVYMYDHLNPYSISGNRINSIFADIDGNIWLGMNGEVNLISRYKNIFNHTKSLERRQTSLLHDNVTAISRDAQGDLWIGTSVGLSRFQNKYGVYLNYRNEPTDIESISGDHITAIVADNDSVWVGTRNAGLNRFDLKSSQFEQISSRTQNLYLTGDNITSLALDSNNLLYVGTTRGLNIIDYQNNSVQKFETSGTSKGDLSSTNIRSIFVDRDDFVWIGTDAGLNKFDKESESFVQYTSSNNKDDSLSNDRVNAIWQDANGFLWVGTSDGVLNRLDKNGEKFRVYDSKRGIDVDTIYAILGEGDVLWFSSNRGLFRFDTQSENVRRYTRTNGLQNEQFNQGAFFIDEDGRMFFGGNNGFNSFHSNDIEDFYGPSKLSITNIYIDGIAVQRGDEIELTHQNNTLTIEFATLDYTFPEKNQYVYKLEGVDIDNINAGNRNIASYTNLAPGSYEFSVQGRNFVGIWNDIGAKFNISVKPHPLKTWWAYTIYVLSTIMLIWIIIKVKTSLHEKEIKRQKVLVENLKKLDKMKDDFLANTSHELRTPLNGIIGISETLRDGILGELPQKAKNNVIVILNSSKRLLKLVNDILDLAVMNKGEFTVETVTIDFRNVLDECLTTLKSLAERKKLKIIDNFDDNSPLVEADPQRIQQIIFNIVGNAIKFTSEGNIEIGSNVKDGFLEIYIKDTGRGIPKEKLKHIFEEFAQVDSSDTKSSVGTGLGLAITKNLIELMGGEISVKSKVGEGSTFKFTLPISHKTNVTNADKIKGIDQTQYIIDDIEIKDLVIENQSMKFIELDEEKMDRHRYKILIVDDETINRVDLNNRFMAEGNFEVLNASDGVEALKIIESHDDIDLVLMDVMMPNMSGIYAAKHIRQKYNHYQLPILMLTAKDQVKDIIEGFAAGANDYLAKPYDREILKARSKNLLGLRRGVKLALDKAESLKGEKQKRMFSDMLVNIANEVSKTLNTSKVLSLVTSRMQNYFYFEKSVGCIMLEGGIKFVGIENKEERDEILASFLENSNEDFLKKILKFAIEENYKEDVEKIKSQGIKSKMEWMHFPIVYSDRLHGVISVCESKEFPLDDANKNVVKAIIGHVAASIENTKLYGRVKNLATVDSLTGLNSRRHFFDKAAIAYQSALNKGYRYSIMMMDIDNFKNINDTYGHSVGDEVLRKIGSVLKSVSTNQIVLGRFGGEEFIVSHIGGKEVLSLAEKIRKMVEKTEINAGEGKLIKVTVSVGVSTVVAKDDILEEVIKRADEKLYKAKTTGKNKVIFDENEFN